MEAARTQAFVDRLFRSAQRYAQLAAEDLARGRIDDAMAHSGMCLEHMAKAALARRHPLLIVDAKGGSIDLAGMEWALTDPLPDQPKGRTISATEALRRCDALIPGLRSSELRTLLDARNGAIHVGASHIEDGDTAIGQLGRAADKLLPSIGRDTHVLWGHFHEAITGRIEGHRNAVARTVADKRALASQHLEVRLKTAGPKSLQAIAEAVERRDLGNEEAWVRCPACGHTAIGDGDLDVEIEPEYSRDGDEWYISGPSYVPTVHLAAVKCDVCGLFLDGEEEIRAAGLDVTVQIDHFDPGHHFATDGY